MAIMTTCTVHSLETRRAQAKRVGDRLVRQHGKQRYYTQTQVRRAHSDCGLSPDLTCLSMALFMDRGSFDAHHAEIGEICDYGEMRSQMLGAVAKPDSSSFNPGLDLSINLDWLDLSWIEFPDIDWSIFDLFDL